MVECQQLFFWGVKQIWNISCVISFKDYTEETNTSKFQSEIIYFFQLSIFSSLRAMS